MKILSCDTSLSISEFRKRPYVAISEKAICVFKDSKPAFYTLNQLRYAQLLSIEKQFNEMISGKNLPF